MPNQLFKKRLLTLSIASAMCAIGAVQAAEDAEELSTLEVESRAIDTNPYTEKDAPYKANESGDSRRVKTLDETPQTITVITQEEIRESGNTDLRNILADQPGITLGTGENGNAFGDRYIIRGHEARSDVYVDGLRDPGMTTRESFAVDQIEVTKGPSATFAGRGSTGGAVNSVTKQANTAYNFTNGDLTLGEDDLRRLTLDSNIVVTDDLAVRLNALHAYREVPDRDPADRRRNGIALSAKKILTEQTSLTADLYYLDAKDKPDLGTYIVSGGRPVSDIPTYVQSGDFLESKVVTGTLRLEHAFNDNIRLKNSLRYGETDNGYLVTGARGTTATFDDGSEGFVPALSTHQGWQEVEYFVNQLNLFIDANLFSMQNQFIVGVEYSDLEVKNGVYSYTANGATNCTTTGRRGTSPSYCITDANGNAVNNIYGLMDRSITKGDVDADYSIETVSVYAMDTIDVTDNFILSGGVRVDHFDYQNVVTGSGETTDYSYSDDLFNGHIGAVYKFNHGLNAYANLGSATNINGGESDLGSNCGYGGLCADSTTANNLDSGDPERTQNIEAGVKWNLNNYKLLLTAAVFQITKDDVFEGAPRGSDYSDIGSINTGKNRVRGFELGLVGNITSKLSTQLGFTIMDSEILKSSDEDNVGKQLSNFADNSAHAQLRYQATPKFSFGAAATYSSELYSGQPDSAASENYKVPSYTYYDAFATYAFDKRLKATLFVGNITDKDYYLASYRSGAFTYIGDRRNAKVQLSYQF